MKLLEAEPTLDRAAVQAREPAPAEARGDEPAPARACAACGAGMQAEQDWCLSCGTAAPGRLGRRPGWRAAATIASLTLALVAGSVAAGYAALTNDAAREAAAPPPPAAAPVAQAPPVTPPSTAQPPAPKKHLPTIKAPSLPAKTGGGVKPVTPPKQQTPTTPTVTPVTPPSGGSDKPENQDKGGSKEQPGSGTPAPTEPTGPVAIELPMDAGTLYDPGRQADTPGDPTLALDGDTTTAFDIGALSPTWGLGYVIDLQTRRDVQRVRLQTTTPGFQVEVYAANGQTPPATVTDPAWTRLHDATVIGTTKKTQRIDLPDPASKYRHLLLWITAGPTGGPRVALSEVTVLG